LPGHQLPSLLFQLRQHRLLTGWQPLFLPLLQRASFLIDWVDCFRRFRSQMAASPVTALPPGRADLALGDWEHWAESHQKAARYPLVAHHHRAAPNLPEEDSLLQTIRQVLHVC